MFLNARYLDPTLGRFISVDPLVSVTRDAYGYGNNNPIRFSDPSGLCAADGNGARETCSAARGAGTVATPGSAASGGFAPNGQTTEFFDFFRETYGTDWYGTALLSHFDPYSGFEGDDERSQNVMTAFAMYVVWAYGQLDADPSHGGYTDWNGDTGFEYHLAYEAAREALGAFAIQGGAGRTGGMAPLPPGNGRTYSIYFGYRPGSITPDYVGIQYLPHR